MEDNNQYKVQKKNKNNIWKFVKKHLRGKVLIGLIIVIAVTTIALGIGSRLVSKQKATDMALKDIGELNTQVAYITIVKNIEDPRILFGVEIPFTKSQFIFSYDFEIKAGFEVENIKPVKNDIAKTLTFKLPKARILNSAIILDSHEVFLNDESIFSQYEIDENNKVLIEMEKEAEKKALENGLLAEAENNAQTLLTSLFANQCDPEEYKYIFKFE